MDTSKGLGRFLSGSAIYLGSNILTAAVPFLLLPVLARVLGPEGYGQIAMFHVLVAALAAFVGMNTHAAAARKCYDTGISEQEIGHFHGACLQVALACVAVLMLTMPWRDAVSTWLGLEAHWIPWAVVVAAATFIVNLRLGYWQVRRQPKRYAALQVSQALAGLLLTLLLVIVLLQGPAGRIVAQVVVAAIASTLALWWLRRDGLLFLSWRPDYWREALAQGVPLVPHILGLFLLKTVDRAVINDVMGLDAAGIYMVAVQVSLVMAIVFDAVNKAYVPWLFERLQREDEVEKREVVRWTYVGFGAVLAMAAAGFLFGPWLVVALAGQAYVGAGSVIGWLALGQAFGGMYLMVTSYIFYSKRTGMLGVVTIGTGALNLLLLFVLIPRLGLLGAALAFASSMALRFLLVWVLAQRRHPMPWSLQRGVTAP